MAPRAGVTKPSAAPRRWPGLRYALWPLFLLQAVAAFYFVSDILLLLLGVSLPPISWRAHEAFEISAALALVVGLVFGFHALVLARREAEAAQEKLRRASSAFAELLAERFGEWRLTTAERDVALFALKGLSTAEIAQLRATSEGTVKAQTASIYRKAGVTSRGQLMSLFIEDLMEAPMAGRAARPADAPGPGAPGGAPPGTAEPPRDGPRRA